MHNDSLEVFTGRKLQEENLDDRSCKKLEFQETNHYPSMPVFCVLEQ
jgi:hypothetical protein